MAKFTPGQSGNGAGRPKGSSDRRTQLRELLQPHAADLISTVVTKALAGDMTAMRLCLDRIIPALKPQAEPVTLDLSTGTLTEQAAAIFQAVADGELPVDKGAELTAMLHNQARLRDADENSKLIKQIKSRLAALQPASITNRGYYLRR
ncbi:DUF5681 domain-containing protein [Trichlorobacter lovleyi]|uniref:DUF5681 domain-containing protein n=1 Tax=Trichlorobacter lovleyi TaxID=313985 RepID=UPI003D14E970